MLRNLGSEKKHIRILAIDGGGIRGIIPAEILAEMEKRTGKRVSQMFDLIAGTSTGGILALALCQPDAQGSGPAHTSAQMVSFYRDLGPAIFSKPLSQVLTSVNGLLRSKYSDRPIEDQLEQFFGSARLSDSLTALLVPSYELTKRIPFFFRSTRAKVDASYDFPMRTVARATSAAPTYFPPESVPSGTNEHYLLVDGGLYANNPAACALVEARGQFPSAERFTLISIGTGALQPEPVMATAENWGLAQWARPVLDTVLDGVSQTVDYQMEQLLGARRIDGTTDYYRFQSQLTPASQKMDNAVPANIEMLRSIALKTVEERARDIDKVCEQLTQSD